MPKPKDQIDYVYHESFDYPNAAFGIFGPEPLAKNGYNKSKTSNKLPKYISDLYLIPLLNKEQEQFLFQKMNFLLYLANKINGRIADFDSKHNIYKVLTRIVTDLVDEATKIRNRIIKANLRLVVSIAKKKRNLYMTLDDLISDGNISLICAINRFDFSRGFKFSTYASKAIMKNYSRTIPNEKKGYDRFTPINSAILERVIDKRPDEHIAIRNQDLSLKEANEILKYLPKRTRNIFKLRFGFDCEPHTLKELGNKFGITKERIRQILSREMEQIRESGIIKESNFTDQKD